MSDLISNLKPSRGGMQWLSATLAVLCLVGLLGCMFCVFFEDSVNHDHNQIFKIMQILAVIFIGACSVSVQLVTQGIFAENKRRDDENKARDDHKKILDDMASWGQHFEWMKEGVTMKALDSLDSIYIDIMDALTMYLNAETDEQEALVWGKISRALEKRKDILSNVFRMYNTILTRILKSKKTAEEIYKFNLEVDVVFIQPILSDGGEINTPITDTYVSQLNNPGIDREKIQKLRDNLKIHRSQIEKVNQLMLDAYCSYSHPSISTQQPHPNPP